MNTYFKDLKIVELASVLAGPAVGMFFAELGAEVLKIENKTTGGDMTRHWKLANENKDANYSAYFSSVNWHKQHLFLDLKDNNDLQQAHDLIKSADIVISNFKTSSAKKMQLDYDFLKQLNPRLIYAHLTGFGDDDPSVAFDIVLQAEAGYLYMTGEPDRLPVRMPVALIDLLAAHQLKEGILLALLHLYRTGEGSLVTTSLFEAAVASLANQATNWLMAGHIPQRMGGQHPNIAPYGDIFKTKDGKLVVLAVGTDKQFQSLCNYFNVPELASDRQFSTNAARVKNRGILIDFLKKYFNATPHNILLKDFKKLKIPIGAVRNMKEVFARPMAKNMILEEEMEDGIISQRVKTVAFYFKPNI